MDYSANSNKAKAPQEQRIKPEKVVTGEVIVRKKPLASRFKDVFVGGDAKSAGNYVVSSVLIPALRNMVVDAVTTGIRRIMSDDRPSGYSGLSTGGKFTYTTTSASYKDSMTRPSISSNPQVQRTAQQAVDELVFTNRDDAQKVLDGLDFIVDQYGWASVLDFNELMGLRSTHIDEKWGWPTLAQAKIEQIREGWLLAMPKPQPIP